MSEPGHTGWEPPSSAANPASTPPAVSPPASTPPASYPPALTPPAGAPPASSGAPYQPYQPYQSYPPTQYPANQYPVGQYPPNPYQPNPYQGYPPPAAPSGGYEVRGPAYAGAAPGVAYPASAYPGYRPVPVSAGLRPVAVELVPGSPSYAVAILGVAPITSGPASASLVAGVGSILVSSVVFCWGGVGASQGWGPVVAGAFALLAGIIGIAALVLGRVGLRQIRRAVNWGATKGRGLALAGSICGLVGLALTITAMIMSFALRTPTE